MKAIVLALLVASTVGFCELPETLNVEGTVYTSVSFQRKDPERVYFLHETGTASVEIRRLSKDLQLSLAYDEAAAKLFREEQARKNLESAAAREAAEARLAASIARERNKQEILSAAIALRGTVAQALDEGALVDCWRESYTFNAGSYLNPRTAVGYRGDFEGRAFVRGLTDVVDGQSVQIKAARMGDNFRYTTVMGATKTVAQFLLVP